MRPAAPGGPPHTDADDVAVAVDDRASTRPV